MPSIKISLAEIDYQLIWSTEILQQLKKYAILQQGWGKWKNLIKDKNEFSKDKINYVNNVDNEVFIECLQNIWQLNIEKAMRQLNYRNKLQNSNSYLEIGSGISILGLILSQAYPHINIYLLDQNSFEHLEKKPFYNKKHHAYYNSFDVVNNCIDESNLEKNKIKLLTPDSEWPKNIDVITSYNSYCWHYSVNHYMDNIISSLNKNGHLILDVLYKDNNYNTICNIFDNPLLSFEYKDKMIMKDNAEYGVFDRSMIDLETDNPIGGRFLWCNNN
tara:strand:- start:606 stop:1427 length:822 start_codon:yes stop_codon:yes gene_type:complete